MESDNDKQTVAAVKPLVWETVDGEKRAHNRAGSDYRVYPFRGQWASRFGQCITMHATEQDAMDDAQADHTLCILSAITGKSVFDVKYEALRWAAKELRKRKKHVKDASAIRQMEIAACAFEVEAGGIGS